MFFLTYWEMEEEVVMGAVVTTVMQMMGVQQVRMVHLSSYSGSSIFIITPTVYHEALM